MEPIPFADFPLDPVIPIPALFAGIHILTPIPTKHGIMTALITHVAIARGCYDTSCLNVPW